MSYILDALRRADAERQQGGVPGLHTLTSPQPAAPTAPKLWLLWAAAALLLLGLGAVLAGWWTRPAPVAVVTLAAPAVAMAPASAVAPLPAPLPLPLPPPLPIVVSAALQTPMPAAAPPASNTAMPAAVQASAAQPKAVPLQQLAAELRRQLPPLVVGGSVWSDTAASRFIILDGQVAHEGDTVAPGLVLDRIQPKSAVLRWREWRLELAL